MAPTVFDVPASVRVATLCDPKNPVACAELVRCLGDAKAVFGWFRRLSLLLDEDIEAVDGDVLRKAMLATKALDPARLRRSVNAVGFGNQSWSALVPFFAAALLATDRLDPQSQTLAPAGFPLHGDNFQKVLSLLLPNLTPASQAQAFNLSVLKHSVVKQLRQAGFTACAHRFADDLSAFNRTARQRFQRDGARIFSHRWTFAIGHMVVTAFMIKGGEIGVLDFDGARVWDGRMANMAFRARFPVLSRKVEFVPRGTLFAESFAPYLREMVDGRPVDLFEACGIVADRAGGQGGAILDRPDRDDPVLARFFEAAGFTPDDRIVTLHCREGGFRVDAFQDLRNVDVASYLPALRRLVERGYRVIRLGDPSMTPLPPLAGLFDYARSPLKSEELDIVLPGVADFHIGSSSGLSKVPLLYGTPSLFLNWYPCDLLPWGRRNWTVLKSVTRLADRRRLLDWRAYSGPGQLYSGALLSAAGHRVVDLSAREIERVVADFADGIEAARPEPAREGRNLGRVLLAGEDSAFLDLRPEIVAAAADPGER